MLSWISIGPLSQPGHLPGRARGGRTREVVRRTGLPSAFPACSHHAAVLSPQAASDHGGRMSNKVAGLVVATALLGLTGCGSGQPSAPATFATARPAKVTKLLTFVVENHSLDQMRGAMPYTAALGKQFAHATNYRAVAHPSLPNYLAMTGGSTFGVADDAPPSSHTTDQPSVFGQALAVGRTAKVYAEGMPGNCATEDSGQYAVKHNPWAYYRSERSSCARYDVPVTELRGDVASGRLPNAGMVVPDLCNDAHNCDLSAADDWLRTEIE